MDDGEDTVKHPQSHGDGHRDNLRVRTRVKASAVLQRASERIKPKHPEIPRAGDTFVYRDRTYVVTGSSSPMWDDTRDPLTYNIYLESWDHEQ